MANSKISALTSATTPLAGTEVLPIVQSSTTVKVATNDLTVRNVRANATTGILQVTGPAAASTRVMTVPDANFTAARTDAAQNFTGNNTFNSTTLAIDATNGRIGIGTTSPGVTLDILGAIRSSISGGTPILYLNNGSTQHSISNSSDTLSFKIDGVEKLKLAASDLTLSAGNLIPATAAKGVNFTANTPAAGMTSQLLNWYEEGTWTPNQGAGLTLAGAFSSTGKYTRIGRQVSVSGTVTGATSVAVAAAGVVTSNLPFTVGTAGHGDATNAAVNASAAVICTGTSVTSAGGLLATGTITFSATYFV